MDTLIQTLALLATVGFIVVVVLPKLISFRIFVLCRDYDMDKVDWERRLGEIETDTLQHFVRRDDLAILKSDIDRRLDEFRDNQNRRLDELRDNQNRRLDEIIDYQKELFGLFRRS